MVDEMDEIRKLRLLGDGAGDEVCSGCDSHARLSRHPMKQWIYSAVRSDGRRLRLLKTLLSNACYGDCFYCAHRRDRDFRRTQFGSEELAQLFDGMQRQGLVDGIFLSSGIGGRVQSIMDRMISTIEIIRQKYEFRGYVHLKILPGCDSASIWRAVELADRVSVNLEAPNSTRLESLTRNKDFAGDLVTRMEWAHHAIQQQRHRRVTQTTQLVVGAAQETDSEILHTSARLYRQFDLSRVYYSAFHPVLDTPLENHLATPEWREHRLYQADWLLRQYGFRDDELCFDEQGNLPQTADPKLAWARRHPEWFPVEVNRADRHTLLRVPGIGPRSARRIIGLRGETKVSDLTALARMGVAVQRAASFVLLDGRRPLRQQSLWG